MSYQTGLSGLDAASTDLDVIGNNIANANTVGFKGATAQFADTYANAIVSAVNNQVGIGTHLSTVEQNFANGTFTKSERPLDVAINGNGFFQLSNNGTLVYSRNGVFHLDKTGAIENAEGQQLMGYTPSANGASLTAVNSERRPIASATTTAATTSQPTPVMTRLRIRPRGPGTSNSTVGELIGAPPPVATAR